MDETLPELLKDLRGLVGRTWPTKHQCETQWSNGCAFCDLYNGVRRAFLQAEHAELRGRLLFTKKDAPVDSTEGER